MPKDAWQSERSRQHGLKALRSGSYFRAHEKIPEVKSKRRESKFTIPKGTRCQVASKKNPSTFVEHVTKTTLKLDHYKYRRRDFFVFDVQGYTVRVKAKDLQSSSPQGSKGQGVKRYEYAEAAKQA